jgi:hypothetical protein
MKETGIHNQESRVNALERPKNLKFQFGTSDLKEGHAWQ